MAFNSLTPNAVRGGRGPLDVKPFRGVRWVIFLIYFLGRVDDRAAVVWAA